MCKRELFHTYAIDDLYTMDPCFHTIPGTCAVDVHAVGQTQDEGPCSFSYKDRDWWFRQMIRAIKACLAAVLYFSMPWMRMNGRGRAMIHSLGYNKARTGAEKHSQSMRKQRCGNEDDYIAKEGDVG
ncbi:hypothetical protein PMIN06_004999 [Paraphaeosphaeria minitans]